MVMMHSSNIQFMLQLRKRTWKVFRIFELLLPPPKKKITANYSQEEINYLDVTVKRKIANLQLIYLKGIKFCRNLILRLKKKSFVGI